MKPVHGEPADGTVQKLQSGEKEFLFRVVIFPQAALYHVGVYVGFTMISANALLRLPVRVQVVSAEEGQP